MGGGKPRLASLDDLVGEAEERQRQGQAERSCGFQIDDQLEFRRLLNRKVGRFGALQESCRRNRPRAGTCP